MNVWGDGGKKSLCVYGLVWFILFSGFWVVIVFGDSIRRDIGRMVFREEFSLIIKENVYL